MLLKRRAAPLEQDQPCQSQTNATTDSRPRPGIRSLADPPKPASPPRSYAPPPESPPTEETDDEKYDARQASRDFDLVTSLALVFQNTTLYGSEHGVSASVADGCFRSVSESLESIGQVDLATCDDLPVVNGRPVRKSSGLTALFVKQLQERDIGCFSITQGISRKEFGALIEVLTARPQELQLLGGFTAAIGALAIGNVIGRTATYKIVDEEAGGDDPKDEQNGAAGNGTGKGSGDGEEVADIAAALSFLTGQSAQPDAQTSNALVQIASDPSQLASLISQATENTHASIKFQNGKTMAAVAADYLKHTFEALLATKNAKTLKGRKALSKTLSHIEQHILDWVEKRTGKAVIPDDRAIISDTVTNLKDDLEIGSLVQDYVKKHNAAERNERRILRYMRAKGAEGLEERDLGARLREEGLEGSDWQELLLKSRVHGGESSGLAAIDRFSSLMTTLEEADDPSGDVSRILKGIDKELEQLAVRAERKIIRLMEEIDNPTEAAEGDAAKSPQLSRKKLIELLAEVIQELCQPLTVIKCVIGTLHSKRLGEITEPQADLLNTAAESADRLEHLVTRLTEVCGVPSSLSPDADIQRLVNN